MHHGANCALDIQHMLIDMPLLVPERSCVYWHVPDINIGAVAGRAALLSPISRLMSKRPGETGSNEAVYFAEKDALYGV